MRKFLMNVRSGVLLFWIFLSTVVYGVVCILVRAVSEALSRAIAIAWSWNILVLGGVKVEARGLERLDPGKNYVFVANHQSYMDILAVYTRLPYKLSFMAKRSLFLIPFFGWAIAAIGHIPLDRGNPAKAKLSLDKAIRQIHKRHRSIFAFPEGTRSRTGEMADFKLGIFHLAIKAGIDIVPMVINGACDVLPKNSWMIRPGKIVIETLAPIPVSQYKNSEKFNLAMSVHDTIKARLAECSVKA